MAQKPKKKPTVKTKPVKTKAKTQGKTKPPVKAKKAKTGLTPSDRKRLQRQRDKARGWVEVSVRVSAQEAQALRDFAATLPPPPEPVDPDQLSLLADLDQQIQEGQSPGGP